MEAGEPGLSGRDVLIPENGAGQTSDGALRQLVEHERADGLREPVLPRTPTLSIDEAEADAGVRDPQEHERRYRSRQG